MGAVHQGHRADEQGRGSKRSTAVVAPSHPHLHAEDRDRTSRCRCWCISMAAAGCTAASKRPIGSHDWSRMKRRPSSSPSTIDSRPNISGRPRTTMARTRSSGHAPMPRVSAASRISVAVGGDSAGGHISLNISLRQIKAKRPTPAYQLLYYTSSDFATSDESLSIVQRRLRARHDLPRVHDQAPCFPAICCRNPRRSSTARTSSACRRRSRCRPVSTCCVIRHVV